MRVCTLLAVPYLILLDLKAHNLRHCCPVALPQTRVAYCCNQRRECLEARHLAAPLLCHGQWQLTRFASSASAEHLCELEQLPAGDMVT
jgi:hypothetical protein